MFIKLCSLFLAGLRWAMEGCVVRHHSVHFMGDLSAQPIIINFHQLFQTRDAPAILPTVSIYLSLLFYINILTKELDRYHTRSTKFDFP